MRHSAIRWRLVLSAALLGAASLGSAPQVNVLERDQVHLTFRPMHGAVAPDTPAAAMELAIPPDLGAETRFALLWPDADHRVEVTLRGEERPSGSIETHVIALEARLEFDDGREVTAERVLPVSGPTTALFALHSEESHHLTLAIVAETERVTVVSTKLELGAPIGFRLEIQRVEEGRTVTLETNRLNTFVGQSVQYSFDLGGADADSALLRLLPVRAQGDVAVIDVEISGRLPSEDGPQLISHSERWVCSRGVPSTASLEHGDPPTGYRFLVTPEF